MIPDPEPPCPICGEPVISYEHRPGYVTSAEMVELVPGLPVFVPGTERMVRAEGAQGPEWTLLPCGDQLWRMELRAVDGVVVEIREGLTR